MAAQKSARGTVRIGPNGEVAIKMGPTVTAYTWFVVHPDNGGYPVSEDQVDTLANWREATVAK